jgi:NTE family protein
MTNDALVLAGGGVAGIAWETGVLTGLQEAHPKLVSGLLSGTTTLLGTSAGSTVAAQLALGLPLTDLFAAQLAEASGELFVEVDLGAFVQTMAAIGAEATSPDDARRRLGAMALEADTPSTEARMAVIESRIPTVTWPDRPLLIPAVNARTGEFRVFDRESGVSLVDAVAASCAVPGIWPTVEIQGERYMDGGMRTIANADLAAGADRVLILVPGARTGPNGDALPEEELARLAPGRVHTVFADDESIAAMGQNPLDPATRRPTALAGRALGLQVAATVAEFWA